MNEIINDHDPSATAFFLLSLDRAAAYTCLPRSQIWELLESGEIPYIEIGGGRFIDPDDLKQWVKRQKKQNVRRIGKRGVA